MIDKNKILFILPWLPYPLKSGGHQAIFNGIKAICRDLNVYITYPLYSNDNDDAKAIDFLQKKLPEHINIVPYKYEQSKKTWFSRIYVLLSILKGKLLKLTHFKSPLPNDSINYVDWIKQVMPMDEPYCRYIKDLIEKNDIKIVQCEMLENISHILYIKSLCKTIFVHHELGFVKNNLLLQNSKKTISGNSYAELSYRLEISLLNEYDGIVTLSEIDKKKLIDSGVKVPIFSSFAIVDSFSDCKLEISEECYKITYIGPQFHKPNYLGVMWFLENCWEQLKEKNEKYHLHIIGKWNADIISIIQGKYRNVYFEGFVDNLSVALKDSIMIVPLNVGSGIRMKILEAASVGIPFVSTTVGVEGIPLINGKDCFIADTPQEFVNSILKLQDINIRRIFAQNANNIVRKCYSLNALRANRLAIYNSILNGK